MLRVIALEPHARLTDLLDDEIASLHGDDLLYLAVLVAGKYDELESLVEHALILVGRDEQLLYARGVAAFAVEGEWNRYVVLRGRLVDLLVDAAEHLFVSRG